MAALYLETRSETTGWHPARWVIPLFSLAGIVLVPWILFLVRSLPSTHAAAHWDIAWAGFDLALALLLLGVAVAAWRRSPWLEGAATAAAALLAVDAWFDVLTSSTNIELAVSIGEAALVELPLAVLCLLLARDAERLLSRLADRGGVSRRSEPARRAVPLSLIQRSPGSRIEEEHSLGRDLQAHPLVGRDGGRRAETGDEQLVE
jgi:hypothetical protein